MPTILLVESARRKASFAPALQRRKYEVVRATTARQAIKQARLIRPQLIVLDSTTQRMDGVRICHDLRAQLKDAIILLLMHADLKTDSGSDADYVLREPFTARKLLNRIARMLPGEQQDILQVGDITLNLANRCVRTGKTEYQLTPKQSQLLALFMRQVDEVVSRRVLMKNVWETDYMGDTRTLDVHIRWLREIIEADPSRPCTLVTVRGVGYKLISPSGNHHN
jgi:DNA-binding response OmpR family regulator